MQMACHYMTWSWLQWCDKEYNTVLDKEQYHPICECFSRSCCCDCNDIITFQDFAHNFYLPYTWYGPVLSSTSCCTCSSLSGIICLIGFDRAGIFELYVVRYSYCLGCCSALRTKQDHAVMVSEISRFVPPEPNMRLLPQQVLAVAIGNCPNIKVQDKHVQTFKIMSCEPISFIEWVGVCLSRGLVIAIY